MLSLVTAAEHQYRYEARTRDREIALRASIRERRAAPPVIDLRQADAAPRRRRAAWARPIGVHASAACTTVACATA